MVVWHLWKHWLHFSFDIAKARRSIGLGLVGTKSSSKWIGSIWLTDGTMYFCTKSLLNSWYTKGRQALLSVLTLASAYTKRLCQKNCYLSVRYWIDLDIEISYTKRILARKTGRYSPFGLVNSSRQLPNGLRRSPKKESSYRLVDSFPTSDEIS